MFTQWSRPRRKEKMMTLNLAPVSSCRFICLRILLQWTSYNMCPSCCNKILKIRHTHTTHYKHLYTGYRPFLSIEIETLWCVIILINTKSKFYDTLIMCVHKLCGTPCGPCVYLFIIIITTYHTIYTIYIFMRDNMSVGIYNIYFITCTYVYVKRIL